MDKWQVGMDALEKLGAAREIASVLRFHDFCVLTMVIASVIFMGWLAWLFLGQDFGNEE